MRTFLEFVDIKRREADKQLKVIKKLLEHVGFEVDSFLDEDDPYLFVFSNEKNLSFEGIRLYKIGGCFAFRVQKEKDTHPYGTAYKIDLEEMFNDFVSEKGDEEKAGKAVIKAVKNELDRFFKKSFEAEQDLRSVDVEDPDAIEVRPGNTDYSNMIMNKL